MHVKINALKAFAVIGLSLSVLASCKKDDGTPTPTTPTTPTVNPYGKVAVTFTNEVDGQAMNVSGSWFTNPTGNPYNISLLKYYVTNFTLVKEDGSEKNFKTYKLIDGADAASGKFTLDSVANGNYTAVKFYLGVDSARNHTGAQDGDLDPIHGMIWTWNTGYIFFKHEGQYKEATGATKSLLLHLGTDAALASITVPVSKFEVKGDTRSLFLKFNLNSMYGSPTNVDFNVDNSRMSTAAGDRPWISTMKANAEDAFSFDKVQLKTQLPNMQRKPILCSAMATAVFLVVAIASCKKDDAPTNTPVDPDPTPYTLAIPAGLPQMQIPADNPLTVEGIALGRKLFFDPILSGNQTMSCGSCRSQKFAFTDSTNQFSVGIDNVPGTRNSMPLFNLGYQKKFFWDGGAADMETQVIGPIENPVEMHAVLSEVIDRLNAHPEYPALFKKAFGADRIASVHLMRAIAQFERTMVSGNSKFDKWKRGEATLTAQELNGLALFETEAKGDCNHCHVTGSTFSDFEFRNNGVDSLYTDAGRYRITLNPADSGKFKTPSLRNIALTAPYMHDGRFRTLQECLDHYNTGFRHSPTLDPALSSQVKGRMNAQEMADIIAFLHTLSDEEFTTNPAFKKP